MSGPSQYDRFPFMPRIYAIHGSSDATSHADEATVDHNSYCSAPPFVLPPRPSRAQEAWRPRALIWMGKLEVSASEAGTEYAINDADEVNIKPDIAPRSPTVTAATCSIRPATPPAASFPNAQRFPLPNVIVWLGANSFRATPPRVRPPVTHEDRRTPAGPAATAAAPAAERLAAQAAAAPPDPPRRPGRPLGSKNKPRVEGKSTSTPLPMRRAAKSSVRKTRESLSRQ